MKFKKIKKEGGDKAVQLGSRPSVRALYEKYQLELTKYIQLKFGAGPPDPEDVVQMAFTRFSDVEDRTIIENPRAYLYRTAHNIVVSAHRTAARHGEYITEQSQSGESENLDHLHPERVLLEKERFEILKEALKKLPERERKLLVMHRVHGLSYAEIARRMDMSTTEVKRQVARAIITCHEELARAFRQDPL